MSLFAYIMWNSTEINPTISTSSSSVINTSNIRSATQIFISAIITFGGCTSNLLAFLGIIRQKNWLRKVINPFFLNLAVADFAVCASCLPMATLSHSYLNGWITSYHTTCKILPTIQAVAVAISSITIVAINFERLYAVATPTRYSLQILGNKIYFIIALIWLISFIFALPNLFFYRASVYTIDQKSLMICNYIWGDYYAIGLIYILLNALIYFILPSVSAVISFRYISFKLSRNKKYLMKDRSESSTINGSKDRPTISNDNRIICRYAKIQRAATRLAIIVTSIHVLSWSGYPILLLLQLVEVIPPHASYLLDLSFSLKMIGLASSSLNPIIYVLNTSMSVRWRKWQHRSSPHAV